MRKFQILKYVGICLLIVNSLPLTAASSFTKMMESSSMIEQLLFYSGLAVLVAGLYALWNLYSAVAESERVRLLQELGIEDPEKNEASAPKETWLQRQYKAWTNVVPVEREQDVMLDHNYDGIRELDNSLPPWWVAMFYITIAIGVVYFGYYHMSDYGVSSQEAYAQEMEVADKAVRAYLATQASAVDETNVEMLADADQIAMGESIFKTNCATCHGMSGEGMLGLGPNLTDNYWLHGGSIKDVFKTIKYGVPEKGMIAWKAQLRPVDMHRVASYIQTLVGTEPANPKAPEGELYQPEQSAKDTLSQDAVGLLEK
jgi:cytochrome c oxidase cbb3-type subunit 3